MTVTAEATGTQSASVGTEHTLSTQTGAKVFQLIVDIHNMVAGDTLELRAYMKVLTGGSAYLAYQAYYAGDPGDGATTGSSAQGEVVVISPPVASAYSVAFTLKQTAGTSRNFDWAVVSV